MNKIKKFIRVPTKDKVIYIKVLLLSALYRLIILIVPFKKLSKRMGEYNKESIYNPNNEEIHYIYKISKIIRKVCFNTPWESKCLVQALIGQRFLYKKKIESTLFLGVSKDSRNEMIAHAWLKCGEYYVTGYNGVAFGVVAKYLK